MRNVGNFDRLDDYLGIHIANFWDLWDNFRFQDSFGDFEDCIINAS